MKLFPSADFFMLWVMAGLGNVEVWLIEGTFKGFSKIFGRTFQAETYEKNLYGFGFVPSKRRSLCWNKHNGKIQLYWEGIHLVSDNGVPFKLQLLSLLIHFPECHNKKKIFRHVGGIFLVFFMKYIVYQLHNSTFRYLYGTIRSDLIGF